MFVVVLVNLGVAACLCRRTMWFVLVLISGFFLIF